MNHNGDCGCPLCMEYGGTRNWENTFTEVIDTEAYRAVRIPAFPSDEGEEKP